MIFFVHPVFRNIYFDDFSIDKPFCVCRCLKQYMPYCKKKKKNSSLSN